MFIVRGCSLKVHDLTLSGMGVETPNMSKSTLHYPTTFSNAHLTTLGHSKVKVGCGGGIMDTPCIIIRFKNLKS